MSKELEERLKLQLKEGEDLREVSIRNYIKSHKYVDGGMYKVSFDKMVEIVQGYNEWFNKAFRNV
jgi:hypothetical protein